MIANAPAYLLRLLGLNFDHLTQFLPSQHPLGEDLITKCANLQKFDLSSLNATVLSTSYYTQSTEVEPIGTCVPTAQVSKHSCRVQFVVNTSDISALGAEMWLPSEWNGRFLGLGNGGLGGCIDYDNLAYGSSLGFASVGTDNGHNGDTGAPFLNNDEIVLDFASRSVHIETLVGKELVNAYYERAPHHSYYLGCSTGGRQGIYAALHHPKDFDGVLAGAPATNFNNLIGISAMLSRYVGAPAGTASPSFIPPEMWDEVAAEVERQCDGLDGVVDGIITEPDECDFRPEALLCEGSGIGAGSEACLTLEQVEALRKVYAPLYGLNGELLYPRFDPGAEIGPNTKAVIFSGKPHPYADDWMKYVVYNDPELDFSEVGLADIALASKLDPGNISTFNGDLSAFRDRGGKLITYHGRVDDSIPSGSSKVLYNLIARTLRASPASMDEFYRLFLIPGMEHCIGGRGAVRFGQDALAVPLHSDNSPRARMLKDSDTETSIIEEETTNVLLALVDWVENGKALDEVMGMSEDGKTRRTHCRYPMKSRWDGAKWVCLKE